MERVPAISSSMARRRRPAYISFSFGKSCESTRPTGSCLRVHHDQVVNVPLVKDLQGFHRQRVIPNADRLARHDALQRLRQQVRRPRPCAGENRHP